MLKTYFIYILASKKNGTLYIGVTNDLKRRVYEHKNNLVKGFTTEYNVDKLVYYEMTENISVAIAREKQLKKWKRSYKLALIEKNNPMWEDLYTSL
ncbi:MAG: GIY-YIG nuclease family protein [Calditrichaeota bacterium]|nr:MAG: GIY-YIG nuclease family protein [Calditrichota bacterium]